MKITSYLSPTHIKQSLANTPQIVFETTDACNLACKYCLYGDLYSAYGKRLNRFIEIDKAITLLNYLFKLWKNNRNYNAENHIFISFYGGEPLLNMHFIETIVKYTKTHIIEKDYKITYTMTTNGLLLKKYIKFLSNNNFKVLVSLDGNKYNNSYRVYKSGKDSYEDLTYNLDYIRKRFPDFFEKNISFNSVLHDRNNIDIIVNYFNTKYKKTPTIGELNLSGINQSNISHFDQIYRSQGKTVYSYQASPETTKKLGLSSLPSKHVYHYLRRFSGMFFDDYIDLLSTKRKSYLPTGTCIPFSRKVFMTVSGEILPCERISHEYILGKVKNGKVELDFKYCADVYNAAVSLMSKLCNKCSIRNGCVQCAFSISKEEHGKKCGGYMTKVQFLEYENEIKKYISSHPELLADLINKAVTV